MHKALATARALGAEIAAAADEVERTRRIPSGLMQRIHGGRLARMLLPAEYGGDEVHPCVYLHALEEIARHDGSVAWNLFVANSSCVLTPSLEPDTARTIYAQPHAWMSWGPPDTQRARAVDGGYIVDGTWSFASGCRQANWMGAHCMVEESDGSVRLNERGTPSTTTLLFPASQVTLLDTWDTLGLRGTASDSYRVDAVFVSHAFTGTREEPENRRVAGPLFWFTQHGLYAVGVTAVALGIASAMLDAFQTLARSKTPRGRSRLADQPAVRALVARSQAHLASARAYVLGVLNAQFDSAQTWGAMPICERARLRLATTHAIISAVEVTDQIHKAAGVSAIFSGTGPFERRFRDIHTLSQQIQSRDSHFETVGGIMLGDSPVAFY
jgi:indole-3-acetate monooxygenase